MDESTSCKDVVGMDAKGSSKVVDIQWSSGPRGVCSTRALRRSGESLKQHLIWVTSGFMTARLDICQHELEILLE